MGEHKHGSRSQAEGNAHLEDCGACHAIQAHCGGDALTRFRPRLARRSENSNI